MKVVILTGDQPNQKALCNKIASLADVASIVLSRNTPRRRPPFVKRIHLFAARLSTRLGGSVFVNSWFEMLGHYERQYPEYPSAPIAKVDNINDPLTLEILKRESPDFVIVSGTNLVGKRLIDEFPNRILNLHTGISPYVKGGPNCTNWCLARNWFHLIGNTVMWIDPGIDTGRILATEQTPLTGRESLEELHLKVMDHAHVLYLRVLSRFAENGPVDGIPQNSIADGSVFFSVDWNGFEARRALRNFENNFSRYFRDSNRLKDDSGHLKLVSADI